MKTPILFTLLFTALSFHSFSQETQENPLFDNANTKHELSLNIAPVIGGNYPSNLLYRQHYLSKKGNNVAFRLGVSLAANISSTENDNPSPTTIDRNYQYINVYVGKEWQKQIQARIIGYYGVDLGLGYNRFFTDSGSPVTGQIQTTQSSQIFDIGTIGFLGLRYHFSNHFSVSAETGADLRYSASRDRGVLKIQGVSTNTMQKSDAFAFGLVPLRAIRFALHF